jgi:transcriptional regulator with XRE-family HTH domain
MTNNTNTNTIRTGAATFGARLRQARRSAGLSRCEVVDALNRIVYDKCFGTTWLKRVEAGEQTPLVGQLTSLCAIYAIPRAWLDAKPLAITSVNRALSAWKQGKLSTDNLLRYLFIDRPLAARNGDE